LKDFIDYIKTLLDKKFYGEVVIKIEHGTIVLIKKVTENIKIK